MSASFTVIAFLSLLVLTDAVMVTSSPPLVNRLIPSASPPESSSYPWKSCTDHSECSNKVTRHKHFCMTTYYDNVGRCSECTQCHLDSDPLTGDCQEACGHSQLYDDDHTCLLDMDCPGDSVCDTRSKVYGKSNLHFCTSCSHKKLGYEWLVNKCSSSPKSTPTPTPSTYSINSLLLDPTNISCSSTLLNQIWWIMVAILIVMVAILIMVTILVVKVFKYYYPSPTTPSGEPSVEVVIQGDDNNND